MTPVTINDVASRAGVSKKTVSRVLNDEPHVSDILRERVLAAAAELRYRPNVSARSLRGARSYVVGYLLTGVQAIGEHPYSVQAQLGALAACREAGYHLLVEAIDLTAPDLVKELEPLAGALRVDGVILQPPLCDNEALMDALDANGIAYSRIAPATDAGRSPYVDPDDLQAARTMTEHLLDLGHRRIGFITGLPGHSASTSRLDGYRAAMADWGLETPAELIQPGLFNSDSGFRATETLLALPEPPTAVFASNDLMAIGAIAKAQELGHQLPQSLSIAGFDDVPVASMIWPRLTTMRQPIAEMAGIATQMVIARATKADARPGPLHRTLRCELMVRGSTAPPPGARPAGSPLDARTSRTPR